MASIQNRLREQVTIRGLASPFGEMANDALCEIDRLRGLLSEVSQNFTRDDDLPDDLLPRIDAALALPDNAI
jgi:hypothetical protein